MKLNPLDIRRQQFARKTFGGYDTEEVDGFLKQLADQWESALDDLRAATDRAQETENKLRHYERVEMALQEALESTRESGRRAEAMAEQKARLIIDEAEMRARQIVQDAERDRHSLRQDLVTLTSRQAEIGARLRGFLLSELEILAQFQGDDPVGFIKLQPAGPPAESRSLDGPVESARFIEHGSPRNAASDAPREPEPRVPEPRPSPSEPVVSAPIPTPVTAEPVAPEPVEPVAPEPARADPAAGEPEGAEPLATEPMPTEPVATEPVLTGERWPEPAAERAPEPPPAPAAAPWDAPAAAPVWPPPPPAPGIPAWAADLPEAAPADPPAASWDLRSLVTGGEDNVAGSEAERERIRRILDDLD